MFIKTEADRIPEAVKFCKKQIENIDRDISECDYIEDVNGKRIYMPGSYHEEKRQLQNEKYHWEMMLSILTNEAPFTMCDW